MSKQKRTCAFDGSEQTGEPSCERLTRSATEMYCGKHRNRVRKYGDPAFVTQIRGDDRRRLMSRISHEAGPTPEHCPEIGPCSPWAGAHDAWGYGLVAYRGSARKAHRVVYEVIGGNVIPDGMLVLHHCDNPPCCRLDHLFVGTDADNSADKCAKGRQVRLKGYSNGNATLTDDEVRAIRSRYAAGGISQDRLAAEHGVSQSLVSLIVLRQAWTHIE